MPKPEFDHERLEVYGVGLEFLGVADERSEGLPRGRAYLADQLLRAATSIVLNIAWGAVNVVPQTRRGSIVSPGARRPNASPSSMPVACCTSFPSPDSWTGDRFISASSRCWSGLPRAWTDRTGTE
jgi:hypothetical protein